jgi:hypothetical protein
MGRKKLNRTPEQLQEQKRARDKRYYERHKDKLNAKRLEKYYRSKGEKKNETENLQRDQ